MICWMHQDCLNAAWLPTGAQAVWVFDDACIDAQGWGLKRILFLYECLLELPVEIRRGPTVETLLATGAKQVLTVDSPDPWFQQEVAKLSQAVSVEILPAPPFVTIPEPADLRRFARYWKKAETQLFPK